MAVSVQNLVGGLLSGVGKGIEADGKAKREARLQEIAFERQMFLQRDAQASLEAERVASQAFTTKERQAKQLFLTTERKDTESEAHRQKLWEQAPLNVGGKYGQKTVRGLLTQIPGTDGKPVDYPLQEKTGKSTEMTDAEKLKTAIDMSKGIDGVDQARLNKNLLRMGLGRFVEPMTGEGDQGADRQPQEVRRGDILKGAHGKYYKRVGDGNTRDGWVEIKGPR